VVDDYTGKQIDAFWWEITAKYTSKPQEKQKPEDPPKPDNPVDWPWKFIWGFGSTEHPMEKDADGCFVVNSVGDPFDPPLMREIYHLTLSVTINQTVFDYTKVLDWLGCRNEKPFLGAKARCVKIVGIRASSIKVWQNRMFYEVTTEFIFDNTEGWAEVLNRGPRYIDKTTNKLVLDRDSRGVLTGKVVMIDKERHKIEPADAILPVFNGGSMNPPEGGAGQPFYLKFKRDKLKDFANLGIA
jgi:hypothetical protein